MCGMSVVYSLSKSWIYRWGHNTVPLVIVLYRLMWCVAGTQQSLQLLCAT